jgi:nitrite reductase/ring-hydroxylating ferredoxin subunit
MGQFRRAAAAADLPPGKALAVEIDAERIALFNIAGTLYAIGDTCPHRGGPLSGGMLDGTTVTCPWHGAEFDVCTGVNLCPPAARPVPAYPVRVSGSDIEVEIP